MYYWIWRHEIAFSFCFSPWAVNIHICNSSFEVILSVGMNKRHLGLLTLDKLEEICPYIIGIPLKIHCAPKLWLFQTLCFITFSLNWWHEYYVDRIFCYFIFELLIDSLHHEKYERCNRNKLWFVLLLWL